MSQTIALVDDDRNLLTSVQMALEKEGFKVQTYIDGESALIGLTRNPPDLAVLDIKMPLPTAEVVATATYAAVAAVATTTLATPFFDQIKKKLQKFIQGKVDKWKEKRKQRKDSSES